MSKEFAKDVKVNPETLALKDNEMSEVTVENAGKKQLTYKLKTTRPSSVKPTKAFGVVKAAGKDTFKVNYKPVADEKPFQDSDRITLLVAVLPDGFSKPEGYWQNPNAVTDAHRMVLKLEKAGAAKPKEEEKKAEKKEEKKDEKPKKKEEPEAKSEESEVETESGTESGSEATESGA